MLSIAGDGNVLWDSFNVFTPDTVKEIRSRCDIQAIAISHPHFYTGKHPCLYDE
jgi:hypothetical protein